MAGTSDSSEDERARTLSAIRVERFRRLMAAQERIAEALTPYGVTDAQLDAALAAVEVALPRTEHDHRDFYRVALALYVAELGGRLELDRAVFPRVTVAVDDALD